MHDLGIINFNCSVWGWVIIKPRIEAIMTRPSMCENAELLCRINNQKGSIPVELFFQHLKEYEHVKLFKLILNNVISNPQNKFYTISLNTPIQVIRNFTDSFQLLRKNKHQNFALEILEHDINELGIYELGILEKVNALPNVSLWLDDFGNNQANFDIINSHKIPFSTIKVSKELFWELIDSDKHFLRSLIGYLSNNYQVIVEGVESKLQAGFISTIAGVQMQGYFFISQEELING